MNPLVMAIASIVMSVAAQFALKAGMSNEAVRATISQGSGLSSALTVLLNRYVLLGFLLYGLGALVWLVVLSKWDVSKAYPMVGVGFVAAVGVGYLAGEHITPLRLSGVLLICVGVAFVARS